MNTIKTLSLILATLLLPIIGCKKDITINFPADHNSKVFIEGMLYPGKKPQIFVSKSNPLYVESYVI